MAPERSAFRTDIEGLRGLAILLVVAYHAGVPWLAGGYVGVDVFFVLSGFLITGLLANEVDVNDRVCGARVCSVMQNGTVVFRDSNHLTATFSRWAAPVLGARIDAALAGLRSRRTQ
ncbi:MAG: acyltransferase family protein [Gemmatimonadaceae bacterium]